MGQVEGMRKKKSILFVRPDYHCSFFYRDEFRKHGWKADIFVNSDYPENLLYSNQDILRAPNFEGEKRFRSVRWINHILLLLWWFTKFWRYQFHFYYGRPPVFNFMEQKLGLTRLFGRDFLVELWLTKLFGVKLVYLPTGCNEDESKANFIKLDNGNVCGNCGAWNKCSDELNNLHFSRVRRFFDTRIGVGAIDSSQFKMTHMKYKSIDLALWNPAIQIPKEHQLPKTNNLRILHSAYLGKSGRNWQGRNIKGSPAILAAIERLKAEGQPVEYLYVTNQTSNQIRFYQAQADIVVEQLIYGWWGSTFVETSALGKPVVCYLRPQWKANFLKAFPEYNDMPIVEADTKTIYEVLKGLVTDSDYRQTKGLESRRFAESHFDVKKNTNEFIKILESV